MLGKLNLHTGVIMLGRHYIRVSDEQRSTLIELMSQNDHITIRDASNLLQINYESAKSIWTVYKKEGRTHNLKNEKHQQVVTLNTNYDLSHGIANLRNFDRFSELLYQQHTECKGKDIDNFLIFSVKLLKLQKL